MPLPRRSGILLHPTSLPGRHGSGDLGASSYHFVDWLAAGHQSLWQVLPLGDIGWGNSPYMSPSAFAGNILLIDLVRLCEMGWLDDADILPTPAFEDGRVNYPAIMEFRVSRLRKAAREFLVRGDKRAYDAFKKFCTEAQVWLEDYALFQALDSHFNKEITWQSWPDLLAKRDPEAIKIAIIEHAEEIQFWKFCQWCFFSQWDNLKGYANQHGVEIIGDMPIFISQHSADVWANPHLFDLDEAGRPKTVAGVPPDRFSESGQFWGNPLYDWEAHAAEGYRWWIERMRHTLTMCDTVRIDHFRGFEAFWEIPADALTSAEGNWKPGPGAAVFDAMRAELGELSVIAEDLGVITVEVNELRKSQRFPGMRILQFAFENQPTNPYLPHNYDQDTVVYTGTHDNDTTAGWWRSIGKVEQDYARRYMSINGDWIHWDLIRIASASTAAYAIFPMQDVLGLGTEHRMNFPGEGEGCWEWRFNWGQVEDWHASRLAELTHLYGRCRNEVCPEMPHSEVEPPS